MTGIRSWTAAVTAFGVVVRIEQVSTASPFGLLQRVPYSREGEHFPLVEFKAVGLLGFARPLPLIESVRGNQAPAISDRIAERGPRASRFRSCVDHLGGGRRVLRPPRNETPADQRQFPEGLLRILANDGDRLGGGNVVAGIPVFIIRDGGEVLFEKLLSPRQPIAPAHGEIMADQSVSRFTNSRRCFATLFLRTRLRRNHTCHTIVNRQLAVNLS
jgi:hypothetical protein